MDKILSYLRMQMKRIWKVLPMLFAVNLLACGCAGILAAVYLQDGILSENQEKFRIGIVGELAESYLGLQFFNLIQVMDDSRYIVELPRMTEEEAAAELRRGQLSAYLRIPDGLVETLERGDNDCVITYVMAEGQTGIASIFMWEIVDEISVLVTRSQSAAFGMQRLLHVYGMEDIWRETTEKICLRLVEVVLNRTDVCDVEILGIGNGLSMEGYYLVSLLVFSLMLSGIYNSSLFLRRSRELPKLLSARGTGAVKQVAGEYLAYVFLMMVCLAGVFLLLAVSVEGDFLVISEWENTGAGAVSGFFFSLFPVAAVFAALQFLLYELVTGIVGGVLLQFVCSISMGYLSGCFYPTSFFPEAVKKVGEALPAGVALRYADGCMAGEISWAAGVELCLYLILFLGLSVAARKYRIQA